MQFPRRRGRAIFVVFVVSAACSDPVQPPAATEPFAIRPLAQIAPDTGTIVPNEYLVQLRDDVPDVRRASAAARALGGTILAEWHTALKGYAVRLASPPALTALSSDPTIVIIEPNRLVGPAYGQYPSPNWGLDRIDQRALPLDRTYLFPSLGAKTHVYIIDSGIRTSHWEFGGRASWGADFVDGTFQDCFGHGTAVASVAGGFTYGPAKGAQLVAVRIANCDGGASTITLTSAVDWVTANAVHPAVANISWTIVGSVLELAILRSVLSGVTYTISAGNANKDVCPSLGRLSPWVIVAGATGGADAPRSDVDARAPYSNWGPCVSLFAPGTNLPFASYKSDYGNGVASGTSFSAPMIAGVVAMLLDVAPGINDPLRVKDIILSWAVRGVITDPGVGSPNMLLRQGIYLAPGNQPPLAEYGVACDPVHHRCILTGARSIDDKGPINLSFLWTTDVGRPVKTGYYIDRVSSEHFPNSFKETLTVTDAGGLKGAITKVIQVP